jgi:hypothetical protein
MKRQFPGVTFTFDSGVRDARYRWYAAVYAREPVTITLPDFLRPLPARDFHTLAHTRTRRGLMRALHRALCA